MAMILTAKQMERYRCKPTGYPAVAIAEPIWREAGPEEDPRAVLKGIWSINGLLLHVSAYAIHIDDTTACMEADNAAGVDLAEMWQAHGMDGHADTSRIDGRPYVLFACPFCT